MAEYEQVDFTPAQVQNRTRLVKYCNKSIASLDVPERQKLPCWGLAHAQQPFSSLFSTVTGKKRSLNLQEDQQAPQLR